MELKKEIVRLKQNEEYYKLIFNNTQDSIIIFDIEGKVIEVNDKMCRMYGLTKEEASQIKIKDISGPGMSTELVTEYWERVLKGEKLLFESIAIRPQDKTVFDIEVLMQKVKFYDKEIIIGNIRDITNRKRSEELIKYRLGLEELSNNISMTFVNTDYSDIDNAINFALEKVAEFTNADRSSLFILSDDISMIRNTHEWCANNTDSQLGLLKNIPFEFFGYYQEQLLKHKTIIIGKPEDIPETATQEREWIKKYGFRSSLFIPLLKKGLLHAAIGIYGKKGQEVTWRKEFADMLQIIGNSILNVLERKKVEEHKYLLAEMADNAPNSILIHDFNGQMIYANQRTFEMHGYDENEFMALNLHDIDVPESKKLIESRMKLIDQKGEANFEVYHYRNDKTTFPMMVHVKKIHWAGKPAILSIGTDITKRKLTEKILKESEEKLNTLFETMNEMVVLHDFVFDNKGKAINYRITDCNKAFTKITGIRKKDTIGKLATEVYKTDSAPYLEEYNKVCLSGKPYEYISYYEPTDKHFHVSVVSPQIGQFATITTDISTVKQMEEIVSAKNRELEDYLYVASHDLRSPLLNIQGFSLRMKDHYDEIKNILSESSLDENTKNKLNNIFDKQMPKTLDFILTGVSTMNKLIYGLLEISRTGRLAMNIEKIDMNDMFEDILFAHDFQIKEAGAVIEVEDLQDCYGDKELLNRLFSNIIRNALKYNNKQRRPEIKVCSKLQYYRVIYSIKDNGKGIAPHHLEKIWNVFFRVNPTLPDSGEGIGLSIVKRIVDKHKGMIKVKSEEGKGSTFHIELQKNIFTE